MTSLLDYWPQTSLRRYQPLTVRGMVYETGDVDIDHSYKEPLVGAPEYIETKPINAPWWMIRKTMQWTPGVNPTNADGTPYANAVIIRESTGDRVREVWHNNRQDPGPTILRLGSFDKISETVVAIDPYGQDVSYQVDSWLKHIGQPWGPWTDTIRCVLCERHAGGHAWYNYVAQRGVGLVEIMGPLQWKPVKDENGNDVPPTDDRYLPPWAGKLYWSSP